MWWAKIFRYNMLDMLAESDRFIVSTSISACTATTTASVTSRTMCNTIRFLRGLTMKSLRTKRFSFIVSEQSLCDSVCHRNADYAVKRERKREKNKTLIYLEEAIASSRRLISRGSTSAGTLNALIDLMSYDGIY